MSHSRVRPMTWSMRTPPAWRMAARKVARNGSNPPARSACGEKPVRPQSWPRGLNRSGGAPTLKPEQQVLLARPGVAAAAIHADREIGDQADAHAGVRVPAACAARNERSAIHCRKTWNSMAFGCHWRRSRRTASLSGSRHSAGHSLQLHSCGSLSIHLRCRASNSAWPSQQRSRPRGGTRRNLARARSVPLAVRSCAVKSSNSRCSSAYFCAPQLPANRSAGHAPVSPRSTRSLSAAATRASPKTRGRIGEQRIEEQPARRRIGAVARRVGGEQRVRRAQRDRRRAVRARPLAQASRAPPYRRCRRRRGAAGHRAERQGPRASRPGAMSSTVMQRGGATASVISRSPTRSV